MQVKRGSKIDDKQEWLLVALEVDGDQIEFTHVAPLSLSDVELQAYAESKELSYRFDILRDLYPTCPPEKKVDLETMEQWIKDGCKIPAVLDAEETVAAKVEWTGKHPIEERMIDGKKILIESLALLDSATTVTELKAAVRRILVGKDA